MLEGERVEEDAERAEDDASNRPPLPLQLLLT